MIGGNEDESAFWESKSGREKKPVIEEKENNLVIVGRRVT